VRLPSAADPEVGQLVLLQEPPEDQGPGHAGVVRRRLQVDADTVEVGIQFVRGRVSPIAVLPRGGSSPEAFLPALWIDRSGPGMGSVVAAHGLYQRGRELLVRDGRPAPLIQVDQLLETTPCFERFRFVVRQR
jgi:hypothetical protein